MNSNWGCDLSEVLGVELNELAIGLQSRLGYEVYKEPRFWEHIIAERFGGKITPHKAECDVIATIWGRVCRIEVKFAQAHFGKYALIRGKDWSRWSFRWIPRSHGLKMSVDAFVLLGLDRDSRVYTWVLPPSRVPRVNRPITVATPSQRVKNSFSHWDEYFCPFLELLPVVAHTCHGTFNITPKKHEQARANGQLELFGGEA